MLEIKKLEKQYDECKDVKSVDEEYRKLHPDVDWKAMCGMRDRLIHHYFGVDYEIVWDVVMNEIPKLKEQVLKLV